MPDPAQIRVTHPFCRSGLAPTSDLDTSEWRELYALMEQDQKDFLAKESQFRSPEYYWPRDPLHTWSRIWEYPYAYFHIQNWRRDLPPNPKAKVVDLGSGVTFFPFSIARLGLHVTCTDTDPIAQTDLARAAECIPQKGGKVDFKLCKDGILPFENGEVDAVFCISVLEHIPNPGNTLKEIARILRPNGLLVLTIDIDLRGDREIGVAPYRTLTALLRERFDYVYPETTIHPVEMLDTTKGPYPVAELSGAPRYRFLMKEKLRRWLGKPPRHMRPYLLAVQGFVLTPKP